MYSTNLLVLVASFAICLVSAAPNGTPSPSPPPSYGYPPPVYTTCTTKFWTTSTCETSKTVIESTKTIVIPITTTGYVTKTSIKDIPHTSVGYATSCVTKTKAETWTKTIPITTYTTSVGTNYHTYTETVTKPYTTVKTDHSTIVTKVPTHGVTTSQSTSICPTTSYITHTKPVVSSKAECETIDGGYGAN